VATARWSHARGKQVVPTGWQATPHKAILGTAYELATGQRLNPGDFEGGKGGAVTVLRNLGFEVEEKR
jgi:hypothetical protein